MISAKQAFELAQARNHACWAAHAAEKIGAVVEKTAREGKRSVNYNYRELLIGSESLSEAAAMFAILEEILEEAGYDHSITQDGNLVISW